MRPLGGFQFVRYRYRERIEFSKDPRYLFLYRLGISIWDIQLGLGSKAPEGLGDWMVESFPIGEHIKLGYSADCLLIVNMRSDPGTEDFVFQVFRRDTGVAKKALYCSSLKLHPTFPLASEGDLFAIGHHVMRISDPDSIAISASRLHIDSEVRILTTAFHLGGRWMASLDGSDKGVLVLRLFALSLPEGTRTLISSVNIVSPCSMPTTCLIVFDSDPAPKYLILVLTNLPSATSNDNTALVKHTSPYYNHMQGTVTVRQFEIPDLRELQSFSFPSYWYPFPNFASFIVLDGALSQNLNTLVCFGGAGGIFVQHLWIIDIEKASAVALIFPYFKWVTFVRERDMIVALREDGWLQSKSLADVRREMTVKASDESAVEGIVDPWILEGWKKLAYIPPPVFPCYESGVAVHTKGEIAFVGEFGKELVQISFDW